jgi:general stress protein 26
MEQRVIEELEKHPHLYLATSVDDFVTVRRMGFVNDGLKIWMVTDELSRKYEQIMKNSRVAIAAGGDLQLEGGAILKGHALDAVNSDYIDVFRSKKPEMYDRVSRPGRNLQRPGTRLIEVSPKRIVVNFLSIDWDKELDLKPHSLLLDLGSKKAYRLFGSKEDVTGIYKTSAYKE